MNKEKDQESGLYYYGARYYAAWTCRFISVDPLAAQYAHLNPYNYAGNKPINSVDVNGMEGETEPNSVTNNSGTDPQPVNIDKGKSYSIFDDKNVFPSNISTTDSLPTTSSNSSKKKWTPSNVDADGNYEDGIHIVSEGNTLWGLAKTYGVTQADIIAANNIDITKDQLLSGQKLKIEKGAAAKKAAEFGAWQKRVIASHYETEEAQGRYTEAAAGHMEEYYSTVGETQLLDMVETRDKLNSHARWLFFGAALNGVSASVQAYKAYQNAKYATNLVSSNRALHILAGDVTGGGHAWFASFKSFMNGVQAVRGVNKAKSMFPMAWSNSKILNAVSHVLVNNPWIQQTGSAGKLLTSTGKPVKFLVEGYFEGVKIKVITTADEVITAFPQY